MVLVEIVEAPTGCPRPVTLATVQSPRRSPSGLHGPRSCAPAFEQSSAAGVGGRSCGSCGQYGRRVPDSWSFAFI